MGQHPEGAVRCAALSRSVPDELIRHDTGCVVQLTHGAKLIDRSARELLHRLLLRDVGGDGGHLRTAMTLSNAGDSPASATHTPARAAVAVAVPVVAPVITAAQPLGSGI